MKWTVYPEGAAPFTAELPVTLKSGDPVKLPDGSIQSAMNPNVSVNRSGMRGVVTTLRGVLNDGRA